MLGKLIVRVFNLKIIFYGEFHSKPSTKDPIKTWQLWNTCRGKLDLHYQEKITWSHYTMQADWCLLLNGDFECP